MTLDESVEKTLADAMIFAEQGLPVDMGISLGLAQLYAKKLGRDVSPMIAEIRGVWCAKALPIELANAWMYVEQRKFAEVRKPLYLAKIYARELGQDISPFVVAIEAGMKR